MRRIWLAVAPIERVYKTFDLGW